MQENNLILAIESSCDETSVALIENGAHIKSNIIASQVKSHMRFGGVVPEVASRHHVEQISQVLKLALKEAQILSIAEVDAIAVTQGPGLVGPLLIGVTAAKTLSYLYKKPLIGVNHLAGHIYASRFINDLVFPLMALIVSGGHTELVVMTDEDDYQVIGETQDDAVGEAYDKVGRLLDLPYPAGKHLDQMAKAGNPTSYPIPRAMLSEDNLDFSFSGMKSAVMNLVHNANQRGEKIHPADLAASFQRASVEVLIGKVSRALDTRSEIKQFVLAGGVAANSELRSKMQEFFQKQYPAVELLIPPLSLCGDNAAMIGAAAYPKFLKEDFIDLGMNARPGMSL
ncbi:tRNA (adenosine(37)-N6)-threonylcarbamoyltransferase complex transferase subunit TsaD [Facklamia miroungae]|uniref:tRNA N6-adenosine threonylcarbamoyltransferase n=1 Tax=Facklamia miroungae TaxID=120956 RepID=A0A1G7S0A9_9LACT|nr:tRNA (adenosine(37)-N6)-threonylcarbamoyltransferase complex transferase subunit TsaD [Facklamia miroungae]NKZ29214.1 tRNA (adenosine(37)-N6)-threonylcarbamoyltransferase complex transferase subunit TsaD [Facklamia miroungae]SDG16374.1 N6-L-threonylcarbamoyladenine synthase [Facklamia miroungae]